MWLVWGGAVVGPVFYLLYRSVRMLSNRVLMVQSCSLHSDKSFSITSAGKRVLMLLVFFALGCPS